MTVEAGGALVYHARVISKRRQRSLDQLILLPEDRAVKAYFDDFNEVVLFRLLLFLALGSVASLIVLIAEGPAWKLALPIASLVMIRSLFWVRDHPRFRGRFGSFLVAFLAAELLLARALFFDPETALQPIDGILPLVLLLFRLPSSALLGLLAMLWSLGAGRDLALSVSSAESEPNIGFALALLAEVLVVFSLVRNLTQKRRFDFLTDWRRENQRYRERSRMREELDEARKIQLSMLPRSDPSSTWLDIAGISIPASEVGGDYYEYFKVSEEQQALVVADAAGHGVASGLLLAGVRSCLFLLKETTQGPAEILDSLARVVRHTTGRREFVTMVYALFDRQSMSLRMSSAAHPPILHYVAATREVREIGLPSLPLGAKLRSQSQEIEVTFASGDLFLAYTDGIAETINSRGEDYGNDRLSDRLSRTDHGRSAKEIRDLLLGDVWSFKADGEQTDDITLLVVKVL